MRQSRTLAGILAVIVLAAVAAPVFAQGSNEYYFENPERDWTIGINAGGYYAWFDANIKVDGSAAASPTDVDADSDLGIDRNDTSITVGGFWAYGNHQITVDWYDFDFDGATNITTAVTFDDTTYPVGTRVASSFDLSAITGYYTYKLYNDAQSQFGVSIGVSYVSFNAKVTGLGVDESAGAKAPIPVIGVRGETYLWERYVSVSGDIHGLTLGGAGTYLDISARLEGHITENIGAFVGYRYVGFWVDKDSVDGNASLSGVTFGGEVRF